MNIKPPATLTAKVAFVNYYEDDPREIEWIDITLYFGNGPVKTWRVFPKDVIHNNLNYLLNEEYAEEELEQFVTKKLQELWFPKGPSQSPVTAHTSR